MLIKRQRYATIEWEASSPRKKRGTFYIGPRHVKHQATREFVEHHYVENPAFASEANCRVFAQNSHVAIEVYDFYVKLFNPDYETVSVYDERFDVQYLFKTKPSDEWRSVDHYNPSIQAIPLADGVEIKKTFDTDYGEANLEISYIIRTGAFLKHTIVFTNDGKKTRTFRVVMKFAGITTNKIKYGVTTEIITQEKHVISPIMFFGEDNTHLKLTERLLSLGVTDIETGEWTPTTLQYIVLDVHAQGSKMDIVIGNYALAKNERLLIDPDSDTFTVGASTDDCYVRRTPEMFNLVSGFFPAGDWSATVRDYESGARWTVDIPQGDTIVAASLKLVALNGWGAIPATIIEGEAADDAITFDDFDDYDARPRTDESVNWTPPAWVNGTTYTSNDISDVIQEIVDRGGFDNHIVLFWSHAIGWGGSQSLIQAASWNEGIENPPKLYVEWEAPVDTFTKTFTFDALLQKELTQTFTFDGLLQKELTQTFTFDGVLILQKTKDFTLDALLQKELTQTFTLDALLQKTLTQTFTFDGWLQKAFTKAFTLDALLEKLATQTFTFDGWLQKEFTKTFTLDALLQKSLVKDFTFDGLLTKAGTKTFTLDALLQKLLTKTFTLDGWLQKEFTKPFTLDGWLQKSLTQTFTFDGWLQKTFTTAFTLDTLLQKTLTQTFTFDGWLQKAVGRSTLPKPVFRRPYPLNRDILLLLQQYLELKLNRHE